MKTFVQSSNPGSSHEAQWLAALLTHPAVAEVACGRRRTRSGEEREVAYVQPVARCDSLMLMQHLRAFRPALTRLPDHVTLVSSIPRDSHGAVDFGALARIEVLDDALAQAVEPAICQAAGAAADQVAAVVDQRQLPRETLDIRRLLPPATPRTGQSRSPGNRPVDSRVALLQGGPLVLPHRTPMSLAGLLLRAAEDCGDTRITHIADDGSSHVQTYRQLLADARRVLGGLQAVGLRPGQQVLLQLEQTRQFITGFWACILGGFVPVPLSIPQSYTTDNAIIMRAKHAWSLLDAPPILISDRLVQTWTDLGGSLGMDGLRVIGVDAMRESAPSESMHESDPDSLTLLLLTSGSTGVPKAVMHTHRTLIARCAAACQVEGHERDSVSVNWMPLDHVGGIVMWHLRDVFAGSTQVLAPTNWVLENPLRWLDLLSDHRATSTWSPNFGYALVNERADEIATGRWDLRALRFVLNGGEMIVAATARRFLRLLAPHGLRPDAMRPVWGMSETSSGVTCDFSFSLESTSDEDTAVCVGTALPGFEARIVDENDRPLRVGQVGRLQVRGASVTLGYFRNAQRNAEAFTGDGWFKTGDVARIDDRGLSITGREKDEIIVNGVNIPAAEIEAAAESVAGVRASCTAACALRRSDAETDGMALFFACTADESGRDSQAVAKRVREHLAASFGVMPDELVPLEAARIPRTSIGKIRRAELRQQLEAGEFDQQRIVSSRDSEPSVPQWCYRPQWQRREVAPIHNDASKAARTALMIADEAGVSQSLRDKLCGEGWNVCMVQPPSSRLAIHGALPDVMLYPLHSDALHASSELLHLIQVLEHTGNASGRNMRLIVWTSGESGASSAVAAAAALLRSAMRELPYFMASVVELADAPGASAAAELLHRELHHAAAADVRVRYMGAQRYVQRLAPIAMPLREQPSPLEIGGRYIITGGLGGIGIELASHLLTVWHAKLLIIGRREVDTSGAVTRLQSQGDVRYAAAPVEDLQKLDAAVQAAERYWGASVSGAFHLAGEFHEALIVAETAEGLTRSISPKVDGARSLRILLARRPGRALLVGFGSANGYFGGAGAGAYAAANAAMAALLAEPHERVQTRCLDWSMWAGIGMSRAYSDHRATVAAGFDLISVRQGIASFEAALRVEDRHLIIGIDGRAPAMRPHVLTPPANLEKLVICHHPDVRIDPVALPEMEDEFGNRLDPAIREVDLKPLGAHGHHDRDALRRRICGGDDDADAQPRSDVERLVANAFAEVLGIARVGRDEHFLEIGGNSLAATQVISRLRPQFGSAISVRDLFEHPTVASLAQSLQERPVAQAMLQQEPSQSVVAASEAEIDVNGLTDEQVTAMLDSLLAAGEESR